MKKLFLALLLVFSIEENYSQINMNANGFVGIGGTPSSVNKFLVYGNTYFTGSTTMVNNVGIGSAPNSYKLFVNGSVGIGAEPSTSYKLAVNGTCRFEVGSYNGYFIFDNSGFYGSPAFYATSSGFLGLSNHAFNESWSYNYYSPSDLRLKENIKDIRNSLNTVLKLRGVKYDLKNNMKDEKMSAIFEKERKNKIGFIAQEVNEILPEAVVYDDSTDIYGIDYTKVVPILVEAIKELNTKVESLTQMLNGKNSMLKNAEVASGLEQVSDKNEIASLGQNVPNPFSSTTNISVNIPQNIQKAVIYIYDMQGLQKKAYKITASGNSSITINGYELKAGMYMYTLVVDGKEVDTKKMILTE